MRYLSLPLMFKRLRQIKYPVQGQSASKMVSISSPWAGLMGPFRAQMVGTGVHWPARNFWGLVVVVEAQ